MKNADTLKEIVQISRDGLEFYQDAQNEVESERLRAVFARMANNKRTLIAAFSSRLAMNDEEVPTDGTIAGSLRKVYTDVRASMSSNEDKIYVAQLEETEDRLLKHFSDAMADSTDPAVKSLLQQHFPQVRACHDEMRTLKQQLAA